MAQVAARPRAAPGAAPAGRGRGGAAARAAQAGRPRGGMFGFEGAAAGAPAPGGPGGPPNPPAGEGGLEPPSGGLYVPPTASSGGYASEGTYSAQDTGKRVSPPPDLPSILLDNRIVYLGMPIVPAVSELIIAQFMYLSFRDKAAPIKLYLNCPGTCRADGEPVGFETEANAIYDIMGYSGCPVHTVNVGITMGQASLLLAAGEKGNRCVLPNASTMLCQPRAPDTGARQAIELAIKAKDIIYHRNLYLYLLSEHTGHTMDKLDVDTARPFYMQPQDCIDYGVADRILGADKERRIWEEYAGKVAQDAA